MDASVRNRVSAVIVLGCLIMGVQAAEEKGYKEHERVGVYANKIGPMHNPTETYPVGGRGRSTRGLIEKR